MTNGHHWNFTTASFEVYDHNVLTTVIPIKFINRAKRIRARINLDSEITEIFVCQGSTCRSKSISMTTHWASYGLHNLDGPAIEQTLSNKKAYNSWIVRNKSHRSDGVHSSFHNGQLYKIQGESCSRAKARWSAIHNFVTSADRGCLLDH